MKSFFFLLIVFVPALLFGQAKVVIDSCGLDDDSRLNKYEAAYFNQVEPGSFNFEGKTVALRYGNFGSGHLSKKDYFTYHGRPYFLEGKEISNQLIIFTPEEKRASGGFDAAVVSWSKFKVEGRHRAKLVKRLKRLPNSASHLQS